MENYKNQNLTVNIRTYVHPYTMKLPLIIETHPHKSTTRYEKSLSSLKPLPTFKVIYCPQWMKKEYK